MRAIFTLISLLLVVASAQVVVRDKEENDCHLRASQRKLQPDPAYEGQRQFSFAILGDGPYGEAAEAEYNNMIEHINEDVDLKFVVHIGDIKGGSEVCSDELLTRRFEQFQAIKKPFLYTPGDNEWTDCHRTLAGEYDPLERCDYMRKLFFPVPGQSTGQQTRQVMTQADMEGYEEYVENQMFQEQTVVFSLIHVVGSNNNLKPWLGIDLNDTYASPRQDRLEEYEARNGANLAWLNKTFEVAKETDAPAIVLFIHANPMFNVNFAMETRAGFNDFIDALLKYSIEFYPKPVLLVHGDDHTFIIDMPRFVPDEVNADTGCCGNFTNIKVPNLMRVETFGDTENDWIKVKVNPRAGSSMMEVFRIMPQLVPANLPPM